LVGVWRLFLSTFDGQISELMGDVVVAVGLLDFRSWQVPVNGEVGNWSRVEVQPSYSTNGGAVEQEVLVEVS
jgi:hypothetical protein